MTEPLSGGVLGDQPRRGQQQNARERLVSVEPIEERHARGHIQVYDPRIDSHVSHDIREKPAKLGALDYATEITLGSVPDLVQENEEQIVGRPNVVREESRIDFDSGDLPTKTDPRGADPFDEVQLARRPDRGQRIPNVRAPGPRCGGDQVQQFTGTRDLHA
jgi:hypothetical protein